MSFAVLANSSGLAQVAPESRPSGSEAASDVHAAAAIEVGGAARTKLLADTHRLLVLTRELKAETARNTSNTLSLGLVKKSEEIQKLAALVRAEMASLP